MLSLTASDTLIRHFLLHTEAGVKTSQTRSLLDRLEELDRRLAEIWNSPFWEVVLGKTNHGTGTLSVSKEVADTFPKGTKFEGTTMDVQGEKVIVYRLKRDEKK